jgi:cysteine-rich repeat protein
MMARALLAHGCIVACGVLFADFAEAIPLYTDVVITSETDVLNTGTLVKANNLGARPSPVTVNGVSFGTDQSGLANFFQGGSDFSNQFPVNSPLDILLSPLIFGPCTFCTSTLTISGLSAGNEYRLQAFFSNTANTTGESINLTIDGVNHTLSNPRGGAMNVVVEFTALSPTLVVNFNNGSSTVERQILNAYALHDVTLPCGDGVLEAGEACDDGNDLPNDGCSSVCTVEPGFWCVSEPSRCVAIAPQTEEQQKCINAMNKAAWRVLRMQGKSSLQCMHDASLERTFTKDRLGVPPQVQTAQACLSNDPDRKVQKQLDKLFAAEDAHCLGSPEALPDYGYTGSGETAAAARGASMVLAEELFGSDLDAALVLKETDSAGSSCQKKVHQSAQKHLDVLWRAVLKGKKKALKKDPNLDTLGDLQLAITDYVAADKKSRKAAENLGSRVMKACEDATDLEVLFPGPCSVGDAVSLATCAEEATRCRFCQSLNAIDGLVVDCDDFDNGASDQSCM